MKVLSKQKFLFSKVIATTQNTRIRGKMKGCEDVPANLQFNSTAIGLNGKKYYLKELWVVLLVRIKLNCNCGFAFT